MLETKVKGLMNTIMMCDANGELTGRMSKKLLNKKCGGDMAHRMKDLTWYVKEEVWRKYKILPNDWHVWKDGEENDKKLCQVLMRRVKLVQGEVKSVFWKSIGAKVANGTMASERGYCVKRLRWVAEGKYNGCTAASEYVVLAHNVYFY